MQLGGAHSGVPRRREPVLSYAQHYEANGPEPVGAALRPNEGLFSLAGRVPGPVGDTPFQRGVGVG